MARKRDRKTASDDAGPTADAEESASRAPQGAASPASDAADGRPGLVRQTLAQGWISIAVWMTFGLLLEGLLGYKTPAYLQDNERRELFRLAHAHGTLLGLVLIAAAISNRFGLTPPRAALHALRLGALVMPLGFLLAGIWHYESDPGLAIWLVPPAALLVIFAAVAFAIASVAALRQKDGSVR